MAGAVPTFCATLRDDAVYCEKCKAMLRQAQQEKNVYHRERARALFVRMTSCPTFDSIAKVFIFVCLVVRARGVEIERCKCEIREIPSPVAFRRPTRTDAARMSSLCLLCVCVCVHASMRACVIAYACFLYNMRFT